MTTSSELTQATWVCTSCGYVYDPAKGDADHGISPGVPFEQLPEGWKCPICYAAKEAFDPL
jgi:rubredoxin